MAPCAVLQCASHAGTSLPSTPAPADTQHAASATSLSTSGSVTHHLCLSCQAQVQRPPQHLDTHCCRYTPHRRREAQAARQAQQAARQELSSHLLAAKAAREADARAVAAKLQQALAGCDLAVLEAERMMTAKDLLLGRWKEEAGRVGGRTAAGSAVCTVM